jgi:putative heme degradation protein
MDAKQAKAEANLKQMLAKMYADRKAGRDERKAWREEIATRTKAMRDQRMEADRKTAREEI